MLHRLQSIKKWIGRGAWRCLLHLLQMNEIFLCYKMVYPKFTTSTLVSIGNEPDYNLTTCYSKDGVSAATTLFARIDSAPPLSHLQPDKSKVIIYIRTHRILWVPVEQSGVTPESDRTKFNLMDNLEGFKKIDSGKFPAVHQKFCLRPTWRSVMDIPHGTFS
jgi:hypothetical protein